VLERRQLTARETALWLLIDASHERDASRRETIVTRATEVLTTDEIYLASMVIALFNFYNTFVDVNGVDECRRKCTTRLVPTVDVGYCPPAQRGEG
jgi:hypothetical protein